MDKIAADLRHITWMVALTIVLSLINLGVTLTLACRVP